MIKCRIDDFLEIVVSVDIDELSDEVRENLIRQTMELAVEYAKALDYTMNKAKIWDQVEEVTSESPDMKEGSNE